MFFFVVVGHIGIAVFVNDVDQFLNRSVNVDDGDIVGLSTGDLLFVLASERHPEITDAAAVIDRTTGLRARSELVRIIGDAAVSVGSDGSKYVLVDVDARSVVADLLEGMLDQFAASAVGILLPFRGGLRVHRLHQRGLCTLAGPVLPGDFPLLHGRLRAAHEKAP